MIHLDRPMYLLGYLANQSRVFLIDREFNVMRYTLLLTLIEYKTLVMRGELERANEILPLIPKEHHNRGVCSGIWDITCFIEHLCVSNLLKLLMVLGLCYINSEEGN